MNPEEQFRRYTADYTGLSVKELPFGEMEDFYGNRQEYRLDLIRDPAAEGIRQSVVVFIHGGGFTQPCDKRQAYNSDVCQRTDGTRIQRGFS